MHAPKIRVSWQKPKTRPWHNAWDSWFLNAPQEHFEAWKGCCVKSRPELQHEPSSALLHSTPLAVWEARKSSSECRAATFQIAFHHLCWHLNCASIEAINFLRWEMSIRFFNDSSCFVSCLIYAGSGVYWKQLITGDFGFTSHTESPRYAKCNAFHLPWTGCPLRSGILGRITDPVQGIRLMG